jgi:nucleoid DNA-binding protein
VNPKKVKLFIPVISEKLNIPEDLVKDIIDFYYEEVRRNLTQMNEPILQLEGFGSFTAKSKELPKLYMKLKGQLEAITYSKTQARLKIKHEIEQKLNNVQSLQRKISKENKRRYEFYQSKKVGAQKLELRMEKSKTDMARNRKQTFPEEGD